MLHVLNIFEVRFVPFYNLF